VQFLSRRLSDENGSLVATLFVDFFHVLLKAVCDNSALHFQRKIIENG